MFHNLLFMFVDHDPISMSLYSSCACRVCFSLPPPAPSHPLSTTGWQSVGHNGPVQAGDLLLDTIASHRLWRWGVKTAVLPEDTNRISVLRAFISYCYLDKEEYKEVSSSSSVVINIRRRRVPILFLLDVKQKTKSFKRATLHNSVWELWKCTTEFVCAAATRDCGIRVGAHAHHQWSSSSSSLQKAQERERNER